MISLNNTRTAPKTDAALAERGADDAESTKSPETSGITDRAKSLYEGTKSSAG